MNTWKKILPEPIPQSQERWRLELPDTNRIEVYRTENNRWGLWVSVSKFSFADTLPDQPAPFAKALAHAAAVLEEHLEIIRAELRKMNVAATLAHIEGQVEFPVVVDPVAAIERKGDSR